MIDQDPSPAVGVAQVTLHTDRMEESARFMRAIGMRPLFGGPQVSCTKCKESAGHVITFFSSHVSGKPV
jgi:hypothetical protein